MTAFASHPRGLVGFLADLDRRIADDEEAFARASAKVADRLRREGREAVANYVGQPLDRQYLTDADRAALSDYLVQHAPEDTIKDLEARRIRAAFLYAEATLRALFPPSAVFLIALAPGIGTVAAALLGHFEPLETFVTHCRFVAANGEYEFLRKVASPNWPSPYLLLAAVPFLVVAGLRQIALNVAALNITMIVLVLGYAAAAAEIVNNNERAIAPYCSPADARTGAPIPLTEEQAARLRLISKGATR